MMSCDEQCSHLLFIHRSELDPLKMKENNQFACLRRPLSLEFNWNLLLSIVQLLGWSKFFKDFAWKMIWINTFNRHHRTKKNLQVEFLFLLSRWGLHKFNSERIVLHFTSFAGKPNERDYDLWKVINYPGTAFFLDVFSKMKSRINPPVYEVLARSKPQSKVWHFKIINRGQFTAEKTKKTAFYDPNFEK